MPTRCTSNRCPIHWKSKRIKPDGASLIRPTKIYLSPRRPEDVYVAIRHLSPVGASLIRPTKIYLSPCRPEDVYVAIRHLSPVGASLIRPTKIYLSPCRPDKTFTSPSGISHLMARRFSGLHRGTWRPDKTSNHHITPVRRTNRSPESGTRCRPAQTRAKWHGCREYVY